VRAVRRAERIAPQEAEEKIPRIVLPIEQATKRNLDHDSYAHKRLVEQKAVIAARYDLTVKELAGIVKAYGATH
jgi:hypothetical protein